MQKLQGFRTIIFNLITILTAWLADFNIELSEEHQTAMSVTIIAIINIILRFITKTPIRKNEETNQIKVKIIK
ncbi:MAG: hypothetical protein LN561_04650 [Rickettsia endosymbiont of Labidopullus appendiculatus]|nr:hypothetical protein [Rickettsia endosymbiont of Labidopullus appendiculatus]